MRARAAMWLILTAGMMNAEGVEGKGRRLWKWSVAALAAGNAADTFSSLGRHELNPVLGVGKFGPRATGIKIGISGATIGLEYLLLRKRPELAKKLAYVNIGMAAATGGAAAYNTSR
jgi:hypothetical protein